VGCQYVHDSSELVAGKEAMLSGTTLGADVTPDKGDMSKIDDTWKGESEPEQTATSKSENKKDLASTIKGLFARG
jgi:hypothetical protein